MRPLVDLARILERVFCPKLREERRRSAPILAAVEEEYGVDLGSNRSASSLAAEVAAETGTPLPRDVLHLLSPEVGRLPKPPGYATWALLAAIGIVCSLAMCAASVHPRPTSALVSDARIAAHFYALAHRGG